MTVTINGTTGITNDGGYTGDGVVFADTTPANTLVTTTGGLVGIGTNVPGYKLDVAGAANLNGVQVGVNGNSVSRNGDIFINAGGANGVFLYTNGSERARITSVGEMLVGTTTPNAKMTVSASSGTSDVYAAITTATLTGYLYNSLSTSQSNFAYMIKNNANVGSIVCTTSSTAYVTSSDYRLKYEVAKMVGALEKVALLKPCTYKWKANGAVGQGFIAHELAEVCPDAVIGKKDAVNEDGSIKPQGIDTSFLVATLTAAIQEQQQLITALTARVAALEGK